MKVYFNNDGRYGQDAVNIPVTVNNVPVGFVCEVNEERVTCYLWERYISEKQFGVRMSGEFQDIYEIGISTEG